MCFHDSIRLVTCSWTRSLAGPHDGTCFDAPIGIRAWILLNKLRKRGRKRDATRHHYEPCVVSATSNLSTAWIPSWIPTSPDATHNVLPLFFFFFSFSCFNFYFFVFNGVWVNKSWRRLEERPRAKSQERIYTDTRNFCSFISSKSNDQVTGTIEFSVKVFNAWIVCEYAQRVRHWQNVAERRRHSYATRGD